VRVRVPVSDLPDLSRLDLDYVVDPVHLHAPAVDLPALQLEASGHRCDSRVDPPVIGEAGGYLPGWSEFLGGAEFEDVEAVVAAEGEGGSHLPEVGWEGAEHHRRAGGHLDNDLGAVVIAADLEGTGGGAPLAYLFALGFGVLVLARRRAPRVVLVLTVLGIFGVLRLQFPPIGIALPAVAALYSAAEVGRTWWAVGGGLVLVTVAAYGRVEEGLPTAYLFSHELLTNLALVATAIALGVSVRLRAEARFHQDRLGEVMAAEQAREAEHRLQVERMRIARDLHDAVGHTDQDPSCR
jgi:hypothetical protein